MRTLSSKKSSGSQRPERKSFGRKPSGARSYSRKPRTKEGDEGEDKKTFGERKPFSRERKPFGSRGPRKFEGDGFKRGFSRGPRKFDDDRKPFDRERKPFRRKFEESGDKEEGFKERRSFGRAPRKFDDDRKPFDRERKPFRRKFEGVDDKEEGFKERRSFSRAPRKFDDGDRKPFDRERKPFEPRERRVGRKRGEIEALRNKLAADEDYSLDIENENENQFADAEAVTRPHPQEYTPKPRKPKAEGEKGVRLNKFIANSGICSRREADEFISAGVVSVNGQIVTEMGTKVFQNDVVKFNDETVKGEQKVYILMNKPKDFVTTTADPHAEKTVLDLIAGKCSERVYPVGRLDKSTTGVLLLTNDGDLTEKLTHPSFEKKKIYQVFLDKNLKEQDFKAILKGLKLDDGPIKADALSYIDEDESQVGIEIHSGRNRIVRRIFESLGYRVKKLDRVYFAGLTKQGLRRGQWRFLSEKEVGMLMSGLYE